MRIGFFLHMDLARIEQHHLAADRREYMIDFEAFEEGVLRQNLLEELAQIGYVPLPVAEAVHRLPFRLAQLDLKDLIERLIGEDHAEILIEDEYRLAHDVDHRLDVCPALIPFLQ